ncbi:unnamed protein product [Dibothriocephalus latus]|uniref:Major facilitator superfamily (MFS) profile domain-containing protein n=1 Tax=Dibothriocephalus latus TaxID=60516 RepID=A0A3P7LEU0_DIBLA|nr:unnamed protein product [Dibothriocephalus latus]
MLVARADLAASLILLNTSIRSSHPNCQIIHFRRSTRRNTLLANNVLAIFGAILSSLCLVANHSALLYVGRIFSGLNSGISIGVASIYLMEIAPKKYRGGVGATHQLALTLGIMIAYIVTLSALLQNGNKWPIAIGLGAIPAAISLVTFPFFPESARFLYLIKGKEEEARKAFQRINGDEDVDMFLAEMREEKEVALSQPKFKFIQLFKQRDLRMPVLIAVLIQILQQFSGINAVIANSSIMMEAAGVEPSKKEFAVLGIGILNVLCTIVAVLFIEKAGRRPMLLWPTVCMAGTLLLLTIIVNIGLSKSAEERTPFALTSVVLICAFVACFAVGLGPIPAMIVSEIFRQGPRGAAYSLSQSIQWLCNLIVISTFPTLNKLMKGYVYLPFLVIVVVCWVFFFLFMPETKNKSFDEIARDLAFGTIVVGKRTTNLQTPVFSKYDEVSIAGGSTHRDFVQLKSKA